jgi:acetyl esterase/lipase
MKLALHRVTDSEPSAMKFNSTSDFFRALLFSVGVGLMATASLAQENIGGFLGGPKNPEQTEFVEQVKRTGLGQIKGVPTPILLWPAGAPGAIPDVNEVFTDEDKPALYPYPASGGANTGAAFLVLPGGAFTNRATDVEGVQVAKFLSRRGISAFMLRYRIRPNYAGSISTQDAHRAMRYIRAHAAEYNIDPNRIGIIGFSAGAELGGDAFYNGISLGDAQAADPLDRISARSNFGAMIYGGRPAQKPADAPPTFFFNTIEDGSHLNVEVPMMNALRGAGIPVEAHFYQVGPHGTGMSPGDPQLGQWPELMILWMRSSGFLGK